MTTTTRITVKDVTRHFEGLEDPRSQINRRHPLVSVVVIALMAVLGWGRWADCYRGVGQR